MAAKPIPEGYHTITPYLTVDDGAAQIEFLKNAFHAELTFEMKDEKGNVRHAEMKLGDSMLMVGQARDEWRSKPANFYLYVPDCDSVYKQALAAGGKSIQELTDQVYGDRSGGVEDPQGNNWWIATHIKDVSAAEMEQHMKETAAK